MADMDTHRDIGIDVEAALAVSLMMPPSLMWWPQVLETRQAL
jgi:hypothetical protein